MNTLLIETASELMIVAADSADKTAARVINAGNTHSRILIDEIACILRDCSINKLSIDRIICGTGPGSFTGIRIAVTTARMLAQMQHIPVIGLPSQQIYALMCGTPGTVFATAFDAKKSRIFAGAYLVTEGGAEEIAAPDDYYPAAFAEKISGHGAVMMTGNGAMKYAEVFSSIKDSCSIIDEPSFSTERIFSFMNSREVKDTGSYIDLVPLYARKSDAEVAKITSSTPDAPSSAL